MEFTELILTVSTLGGSSDLERPDFQTFMLLEGVLVLTELILTVSSL